MSFFQFIVLVLLIFLLYGVGHLHKDIYSIQKQLGTVDER